MTILSSLAIGVVILMIIITVHELGHYLAARIFGIKILTVCFGMGPVLCRKRIRNTFYVLASLPIGGFVRPLYKLPPNAETWGKERPRFLNFLLPSCLEEHALHDEFPYEDPGNLVTLPKWKQAVFLIAGIAMNIVLCLFVAFDQVYWAVPLQTVYEKPFVGEVQPDSLLARAGVTSDHFIVSIDGKPVSSWMDVYAIAKEGDSPGLTVLFKNRKDDTSPELSVLLPRAGLIMKRREFHYFLTAGFTPFSWRPEIGVGKALREAFTMTFIDLPLIMLSLDEPKRPSHPPFFDKVPDEELSAYLGFITTTAQIGQEAGRSSFDFLLILYLGSLTAAIINLLPIPAADGGHLAILAVESIAKVDLSWAWKERISYSGFVFFIFVLIAQLSSDLALGVAEIVSWFET